MKDAFAVAQVRKAEAKLIDSLPPGALMQRASCALAVECAALLRKETGGVTGRDVVLLVGSGNNGGDALYAGATLAKRGCRVNALTTAETWHQDGAAALIKAGGRVLPIDPETGHARSLVEHADLVVDGILGIGGSGALRGPAAYIAQVLEHVAVCVVAVDLPSGIDPDTGAAPDEYPGLRGEVLPASVTVTFGALKPGLLVSPAHQYVGELCLIDLGLGPTLERQRAKPVARLIESPDVMGLLPSPGPKDDKYTRGVVGVIAGSQLYPGAAVLCTGAARLAGAGLVRYLGTAGAAVIARWPEVVVADSLNDSGRVQAWVVGPGGGTDSDALDRLAHVLFRPAPVVIDADGLTLVSESAELRAAIKARGGKGKVTVFTPHVGEFARLGYDLAALANVGRIGAVKQAANELGAIVLLKGAQTIIAGPGGSAMINTCSDPALATAGSGDVLSGIVGSMLARAAANWTVEENGAIELVAAAAFVHGMAGKIAARGSVPATAQSILAAVPMAIAEIRTLGTVMSDHVLMSEHV